MIVFKLNEVYITVASYLIASCNLIRKSEVQLNSTNSFKLNKMDLNSSENSIELTKWNPEQILNVNQTEEAYAIIILNRKILFHPTSFQPLWNNGV